MKKIAIIALLGLMSTPALAGGLELELLHIDAGSVGNVSVVTGSEIGSIIQLGNDVGDDNSIIAIAAQSFEDNNQPVVDLSTLVYLNAGSIDVDNSVSTGGMGITNILGNLPIEMTPRKG